MCAIALSPSFGLPALAEDARLDVAAPWSDAGATYG